MGHVGVALSMDGQKNLRSIQPFLPRATATAARPPSGRGVACGGGENTGSGGQEIPPIVRYILRLREGCTLIRRQILSVVFLALLLGITACGSSEPEATAEESTVPTDTALSESVISEVKEFIEQEIEAEGLEQRLDSLEWDAENEILKASIDLQYEPPDIDHLQQEANAWANIAANQAASRAERDIEARVILITRFSEDELVYWAHTTFSSESQTGRFVEGPGVKLFEN